MACTAGIVFSWEQSQAHSAVQQSAYLEAQDDHTDFYEDETLRRCLLDEHGNRLKDAEGNLKTLRYKFAVYCDDICAGAANRSSHLLLQKGWHPGEGKQSKGWRDKGYIS
jgi:hypothetical protein